MVLTRDRACAALRACARLEDFRRGALLSFLAALPDEKLLGLPINDGDCDDEIAGYLHGLQMRSGAQRLPIQAASYAQLAEQCSRAPGVASALDSLIGLVDGDAFLQCWQENSQQLQALKLFIPLCTAETTPGNGSDPYEAGGAVLEAISRVVLTQPGSDPGKALVLFKQAAGDETQPDVAWCGFSNVVELLPSDLYKHLLLALEYKTDVAMRTPAAITTGTGQLIARAAAALMEQGLDSFTLPGAVLDNRRLVPVIVTTSASGSTTKSLKTVNSQLLLFGDDAKPNSSGEFEVDTTSQAFKELVHLCWVAAREQVMRAAADPSRQACLEDGSCVAVLPSDGAGDKNIDAVPARYRVLRKLAPPSASGCAYLAVPAAAAGPRLMLKVAAAPELAAQARGLCLPLELWNQVPREIQALSLLEGHHTVQSLPQLVNHGLLDVGRAAAGRALQGAAVVVTQLLGEALVQRGQVPTPLPVAEAERLLWDIFEALAVLQTLGIQHCDVGPRNLGRRTTASGTSNAYYLYDFGSAVTAAELATGPALRLPCDLLLSPFEVLLGAQPGPLADAVALIFTGLALAGVGLPWSGPAAAGNDLACIGLKVDFMTDPAGQLPAWAQLFSPELRRLCEDVMSCALEGLEHGSWLADRLYLPMRG